MFNLNTLACLAAAMLFACAPADDSSSSSEKGDEATPPASADGTTGDFDGNDLPDPTDDGVEDPDVDPVVDEEPVDEGCALNAECADDAYCDADSGDRGECVGLTDDLERDPDGVGARFREVEDPPPTCDDDPEMEGCEPDVERCDLPGRCEGHEGVMEDGVCEPNPEAMPPRMGDAEAIREDGGRLICDEGACECALACEGGRVDADGDPANGCEAEAERPCLVSAHSDGMAAGPDDGCFSGIDADRVSALVNGGHPLLGHQLRDGLDGQVRHGAPTDCTIADQMALQEDGVGSCRDAFARLPGATAFCTDGRPVECGEVHESFPNDPEDPRRAALRDYRSVFPLTAGRAMMVTIQRPDRDARAEMAESAEDRGYAVPASDTLVRMGDFALTIDEEDFITLHWSEVDPVRFERFPKGQLCSIGISHEARDGGSRVTVTMQDVANGEIFTHQVDLPALANPVGDNDILFGGPMLVDTFAVYDPREDGSAEDLRLHFVRLEGAARTLLQEQISFGNCAEAHEWCDRTNAAACRQLADELDGCQP